MDPIPGIQATDPSERKIYIDEFFVGRKWGRFRMILFG